MLSEACCPRRGLSPVRAAEKEVHATDVARAVSILLTADNIAGQAYNCYDMYIAEQDVAEITKRMTGSSSRIEKLKRQPKHTIETAKLRELGMIFGGQTHLEKTVGEMLEHAKTTGEVVTK